MTVSVVIPHYGPESLLRGCLAALWANTDPEIEVVVVDNGTGIAIDADTVVRNEDNVGFAAACNQGAAIAASDTIVFLNNDCQVHAGWLEPLINRMDQGCGVVGSMLFYPDGRIQHAGIRLFRNDRGELTAENRRQHHDPGPVEAVTGACLAVRRDLFLRLGGFDESYMNGYEDVDFCLTAREAGTQVFYEPASTVTHLESASGPARWTHVKQNIQRLQDKWAWGSTVTST